MSEALGTETKRLGADIGAKKAKRPKSVASTETKRGHKDVEEGGSSGNNQGSILLSEAH